MDEIDNPNPELNATQFYFNQAIALPPQTVTNIFTGDSLTVVTTINGASGPSITINTTLSGLSFNTSGSTITLAGTLGETSGGTGQSTYAQGDLLYSSATNVLSKLAKDTNTTRYLSNTGTSNNPAWAQINLTNGVTGVLPVANGGLKTNSTNAAPTVNDDSGDGYSVNSLWTDTTGPTTYVCQDATVGAAVWTQIAP